MSNKSTLINEIDYSKQNNAEIIANALKDTESTANIPTVNNNNIPSQPAVVPTIKQEITPIYPMANPMGQFQMPSATFPSCFLKMPSIDMKKFAILLVVCGVFQLPMLREFISKYSGNGVLTSIVLAALNAFVYGMIESSVL